MAIVRETQWIRRGRRRVGNSPRRGEKGEGRAPLYVERIIPGASSLHKWLILRGKTASFFIHLRIAHLLT